MADPEMDARVERAMKAATDTRTPEEDHALHRTHVRDACWVALANVPDEIDMARTCLQHNDDQGFIHHLRRAGRGVKTAWLGIDQLATAAPALAESAA